MHPIGATKENKADLARRANQARKAVLTEIQSGTLSSHSESWEVSELELQQLPDIVERIFSAQLDQLGT